MLICSIILIIVSVRFSISSFFFFFQIWHKEWGIVFESMPLFSNFFFQKLTVSETAIWPSKKSLLTFFISFSISSLCFFWLALQGLIVVALAMLQVGDISRLFLLGKGSCYAIVLVGVVLSNDRAERIWCTLVLPSYTHQISLWGTKYHFCVNHSVRKTSGNLIPHLLLSSWKDNRLLYKGMNWLLIINTFNVLRFIYCPEW